MNKYEVSCFKNKVVWREVKDNRECKLLGKILFENGNSFGKMSFLSRFMQLNKIITGDRNSSSLRGFYLTLGH